MRVTFSIIALTLFGACSFDFDSEADLFTCETDADCAEGFICAGHTLVSSSARSYCVKAESAMLAVSIDARAPLTNIEQTLGLECLMFGSAAQLTVDWETALLASSDPAHDFAPFDASLVAPTSMAEHRASAECLGGPNALGGGTILCRDELGDAKSAALMVRYALHDGGQTLATLFAEGTIPAGEAARVEQDVVTFDTDIAEDPSELLLSPIAGYSNRCEQRAWERAKQCAAAAPSPWTPTLDDVCGCQLDADCPTGYFCVQSASRCWPAAYGEAGEGCTANTNKLCISGQCDASGVCK